MKHALTVFATLFVLTGCSAGYQWTPGTWGQDKGLEKGIPLTEETFVFRDIEAKAHLLAREEFSLSLVRMSDKRLPESTVPMVDDHIIYEYRPDRLLRGIESYMGGAVRKYLRFGPQKEHVYNLEVDVRRMKTFIQTGGFWTGAYGEYRTRADVDITVRDKTSKVVLRTPVSIDFSQRREQVKGQNPSSAQDKKGMMDNVNEAMRRLSIKIGWYVHKAKLEERKYYNLHNEDRSFPPREEGNMMPAFDATPD